MAAACRVEMLGGLSVTSGDRRVTRFRTQKTAALLAFLAYHRQQRQSREVLIDLLWPDDSPSKGRHSLSMALSAIRQDLEPDGARVVVADRESVGLDPAAVETDVSDFTSSLDSIPDEASIEQTRALMAALDLYEGELLPGYYQPWIVREQDTLAQKYIDAACKLADVLEAIGDKASAIDYVRTAIIMDPMREDAARALIKILSARGDAAGAIRFYQQFETTLEKELGMKPHAETQALVREIRMTTEQAAVSSTPSEQDVAKVPGPNVQSEAKEPDALTHGSGEVPVDSRTAAEHTPTLPMQLTTFFGREEEVRELRALLDQGKRLITLKGPPGSGKTRLSLALADALKENYGGRLWFVPLAAQSDPNQIAERILQAMGAVPGAADLVEQIAAVATDKPSLIIIDNFEHLLDGAKTVKEILERNPSIACVTTSRAPLAIAGESVFQVPALPVPEAQDGLEQVAQVDSVKLFVDRARLVRPDFDLTPTNAESVRDLCRGLEGIPLAIELAAARTQVMSPADLVSRLSERFDLLVDKKRNEEERHRTMHNAIAWSYDLLPDELKELFAKLSVFRGGWTAEAAEAVCEEPLAMDHLAQLCDSSLLQVAETEHEMRFSMLEMVRDYSSERLAEEGDPAAWRDRLLTYFADLAEQAHPELTGRDQLTWLNRLEAEHDNLRAALDWASAKPDGAGEALRTAGALWKFWETHGHLSEGRARLESALERSAGETAARARALYGAGTLCLRQSDHSPAARHLEQSLDLYRELGDRRGVASSLNMLGVLERQQGEFSAAQKLHEESLAMRRGLADKRGEAVSLQNLGLVASFQGNFDAAQSLFAKSFAQYEEVGDKVASAMSLHNLGEVAFFQGDFDAAQSLYEQSRDLYQELGEKLWLAAPLNSLGRLAYERGDLVGARRLLEASLSVSVKTGQRRIAAIALDYLAPVLAAEGRPVDAARVSGATEVLRERIGLALAPHVREKLDRDVAAAREAVGDDAAFDAAWEEGRQMSMEEAVNLALSKVTPED